MTGELPPYSYDLPKERIAQRPVHPADSARMLVVDRANRTLTDSHFAELPRFARAGDLFVFNDTKVVPARLFGSLPDSGGAVEVLLVRSDGLLSWEAFGRPMKKIRRAGRLHFGDHLEATVESRDDSMSMRLTFRSRDGDAEPSNVGRLITEHGTMPIPPYIRDGIGDEQDLVDYQTIFARHEGSIAAPTASLHFTPSLLENLTGMGAETAFLTLHVGTASFLPVLVDGVLRPPGSETFDVPTETKEAIARTRVRGGRVIAVGTTTVRALESTTNSGAASASTELFIRPGYQFRHLDAVVTNFHQPGTTHLLLVEALLGRTLLERCYAHALENGYRFLSYGDGMIVL